MGLRNYVLGGLPLKKKFQAFGAEMEMAMYYGEDEGDDKVIDASSPGGIVIEVLSNIRAVASLTLEEERASTYKAALEREDPHPLRSNVTKGMQGCNSFSCRVLLLFTVNFHCFHRRCRWSRPICANVGLRVNVLVGWMALESVSRRV